MTRPFAFVLLIVAACSSTHRFEISSDEPLANVTGSFTNARNVEARVDGISTAVVTARSGDDSGEIRVTLRSGRQVACRIGYITNGELEPHRINIENGRCGRV